MTIKDLAKRLNVSYSTVSKCLNNNPNVSEKTRKRVLAEAEKIGFVFNENARGLAGKKTRRIGIIVSNQFNTKDYRWFFGEIQNFTTRAIEENNYDFFMQPHNNIRGESNIYRMVNGKMVDGLIVFSRFITKEEYDFLEDKKFPTVYCYYNPLFLRELHENLFLDDDEYGGYIATKYLIEKNHRKIVSIKANDPAMKMYTSRTDGYIKAMKEYSLTPTIVEIPMTFESGRKLVNDRLEYLKRFTAFFVQQDLVALSMIYELNRKYNIKVPREFSIVGYNNIDLINDLDIPLTSINDPMKLVISSAVVSLISIVEKKEENQKRIFYPEIIERQSVRRI